MAAFKSWHLLSVAAAAVLVLTAAVYRDRPIPTHEPDCTSAPQQPVSNSASDLTKLCEPLAANQPPATVDNTQSSNPASDDHRIRVSITNYRKSLAITQMPAFNPDAEVEVPFSNFKTSDGQSRLLIEPSSFRSAIETSPTTRLEFGREGVPLKLIQSGAAEYVVFFREALTNKLWLYRFSGSKLEKETEIKSTSDSELILREAVQYMGKVLAIVYDNDRGVNDVILIDPYRSEISATHEPVTTLSTLEDPAGTHYEMMPSLFMLPQQNRVWIVGGTLIIAIEGLERKVESRLEGCIRAQEVVLGAKGPAVLCLTKDGLPSRFGVTQILENGAMEPLKFIQGSIPFGLRLENDKLAFDLVETVSDIPKILRRDLEENQVSGVMELGTNNIEGRIAWSQIYFLNGLLDLLMTASSDNEAFDRFEPLIAPVKRRLDLEMFVLNRQLESPSGVITKAFTAKREPAIFAVQTSRILLLFDRYRREISQGVELSAYSKLRQSVISLDGHIEEVRANAGERVYLAWPKGSAFYFDGLNVPYNHQNEWAQAIFDNSDAVSPITNGQDHQDHASQFINRFIQDVAVDGEMPNSGEWPYWWGQAHKGWSETEGVSVHTPSYAGDKSVAYISFRSIDVMSILAAERYSTAAASPRLIASIARLVADGKVYPFVNASFFKRHARPVLKADVAAHYARMTAPWDLQSAVWALLDLPAATAPEDPNSLKLNKLVLARLPDVLAARPDTDDAADVLQAYFSVAVPYNVELARKHQALELGGKILAWNLAYDLDAAVAAYERTSNDGFKRWIQAGLDTAMSMRDDRIGRRDEIRERVMPAWGSNRYSPDKKKWMAWDAFTGAIIHPAIIYADLLQKRSQSPSDAAIAAAYLEDSTVALDSFDDSWRSDIETGSGWYLDPLYQDVAPLNHMNLLGLAHIELCTRFQRTKSCDKAKALARFFRSHLKRTAEGTCDWEYWAGATKPESRSTSGEDITHAHINVRFAHAAWKGGLGFERDDLKCIAATLNKTVIRKSGDWAMGVDGKGDLIASGLHEGLSAWGVLDELAPGSYKKIDDFMLQNPAAYPLGLLSYATGPGSFARRLSVGQPH